MYKYALITTVVLVLGFAGQASAHARLVSAYPQADSANTPAPEEIDLTFSEALTLDFSGLTLTGPDGKAIDVGPSMLMNNDKVLMYSLQNKLGGGTYTINWHAFSSDGHKTSGSYSFTVKP